ncbi:MAG TPA: PepSY-associated TM helix domain-containing protein [Gemmatimonadaceae bacterium]|nr:PepSY-associated TM helix domain-containing protein [Gemmatimonadaceae bacterium]
MTTSRPIITRGAALASEIAPRQRGREQKVSRAMFYAHLWLGVIFTALLLVVSVTGILLNHKRELGLLPDVQHTPTGPFTASLPLAEIASRALLAAGITGGLERIDRMDVRPRNGFAKVRLRDEASTEVTVDLVSGGILHIGPRGDVFLEKVHSGEALGTRWVLLTTVAAVALIVLFVSGYWLWLVPKSRQ